MRIAIVGSRSVPRSILLKITEFITLNYIGLNDSPTLVSGGAAGIDSLAEGLARGVGYPVLIFKPEWDRYGKSAGFKRNQKIVDAADKVIAISINGSPGTADTIRRADAAGKPLAVLLITPHPKGDGYYFELNTYNTAEISNV